MKTVQVMFDEETLEQLDALDEVKSEGRSAVLRRVTEDYLNLRRQLRIDEQYRRGYAEGLGEEWAGWAEEGLGGGGKP